MFDLLEHATIIGSAKNIELRLHTNASIFNSRYLEILSKYKKVTFQVSIDSHIPAQLEYIRHKANYNTVIENTEKFKQVTDQYPNIVLGITNTITPLNVLYVDKTNQYLSQSLKLPVITNIVTTPEYDIRHLPIPIKQYLIDHIKNSNVNNFLQQTISGCNIEWPRFCQATDKLDQLRNQQFSNVFPEWWSMLEPYWINVTNENI
jgi:MoaA/NifB/PqqE/SkfB family radical SAM enzyme